MRRMLIAGNWKMNKDIHESALLVNDLKERLKEFRKEVDVAVFPPFPSLVIAKSLLGESPVKLGAQNMSEAADGAVTGEVSARMLKAAGCDYVILGHSERRRLFSESNALINAKAKKALAVSLTPVICVGETLEEREANVTDSVVGAQIKGVLHELSAADIGRCAIAYEPVWAIGTGRNATPQEANRVHALIRKLVARIASWELAEQLVILYGGSVNPSNAGEILSESDVDGALVGGASLKGGDFVRIIQAGVESRRG